MSLLLSCCGFGHREVLENISEKVYEAVLTAADQGVRSSIQEQWEDSMRCSHLQ